MYIKQLIIKNFKGIKELNISFNKHINLLVGANGIGKSTILEAIELTTRHTFRGQSISETSIDPYWFNLEHLQEVELHINKKKQDTNNIILPEILIEIYLQPLEKEGTSEIIDKNFLLGTNNSLQENTYGLLFAITPKQEARMEFNQYILTLIEKGGHLTPNTLPLEFFEIVTTDFSGNRLNLREINPKPIIIKPFEFLRNVSYRYYSMIDNISEEIFVADIIYKTHREISNIVNKYLNKEKNADFAINITPNPENFFKKTIVLKYHDIPFHYLGAGEQIQHQLEFQLDQLQNKFDNKIQKYDISIPTILMEEPESHLSYLRLEELLSNIEKHSHTHDIQFIITTHNSLVTNRLGLKNLIFLRQEKILKSVNFNQLEDDTQGFFKVRADTNILKILLANKILLVEGPSDKLIIEAYYYNDSKKMPQEDNIEILEIGTSFKRYLDVYKILDKKVRHLALVTDNDNRRKRKIEDFKNYNISKEQIFIPADSEGKNLEHAFLNANEGKLDILVKEFALKNKNSKKEILEYMTTHKTEWSFKIFSIFTNFNNTNKDTSPKNMSNEINNTQNDIKFPQYIIKAVEWLKST